MVAGWGLLSWIIEQIYSRGADLSQKLFIYLSEEHLAISYPGKQQQHKFVVIYLCRA